MVYYAAMNILKFLFGTKNERDLKKIAPIVDRIKKIVQNKMRYCQGLQSVDYFAHVFGH